MEVLIAIIAVFGIVWWNASREQRLMDRLSLSREEPEKTSLLTRIIRFFRSDPDD